MIIITLSLRKGAIRLFVCVESDDFGIDVPNISENVWGCGDLIENDLVFVQLWKMRNAQVVEQT